MNTPVAEEFRQQAEALANRLLDEVYEKGKEGVFLNSQDNVNLIMPLIATALQAAADKAREWQPIETAPKDGCLIDLWCPWDGNDAGGIRLTDVSWHIANEIFPHTGWVRVTDDGNWDLVESPATSPFGLPAWYPSHYMLLPAEPHTPRNAQQSEAVIAKALGQNLTVVKEDVDRA